MSDTQVELALKLNQITGPFFTALHQPFNQRLTEFFEQQEAHQGADSSYAQIAAGVSPQEANYEHLLARNPYSNPAQQKAELQDSAGRGWITLTESGFRATSKAIAFTDRLVKMLADYTTKLEADLDEVSIRRAVELLGRLVDLAQAVEAVVEKTTFTFARNYEYEDKSPSLLWVRRHLITLGAFRDDCHIASWKELDLPGHAWEALTFVWQDQAHTPAELAEQLPFRGFEEADYALALERLANLGWVQAKDEKYSLTGQGRHQREGAEEKTNQYYKAAFDALSRDELKELITLIERLTEALTPEEEAQSA